MTGPARPPASRPAGAATRRTSAAPACDTRAGRASRTAARSDDRQAVDPHVDNMPGLSDHKKRFLKSHPSLLQRALSFSSCRTPTNSRCMLAFPTIPRRWTLRSCRRPRDLEHHRQLSQLDGGIGPTDGRERADARRRDRGRRRVTARGRDAFALNRHRVRPRHSRDEGTTP